MIAFVYSIYQDKLKISTWILIIIMIIVNGILWWNSINVIIDISNKEDGNLKGNNIDVLQEEMDNNKIEVNQEKELEN